MLKVQGVTVLTNKNLAMQGLSMINYSGVQEIVHLDLLETLDW